MAVKIMKLHEYQNRIIHFLEQHPQSILSVDMGLGKTAAVLHYVAGLQPETMIIVAPKRVAETVWKQEAEKWELTEIADKMVIVRGTPTQRRKALQDASKPYKVVGRDNLKDVAYSKCELLVLDELTSFKSHESKRTKYVCSIKASRRIGLTGTFLANGAIDIYGQAEACNLTPPPFNFWAWRAINFRDVLEGSGLQFHKWKPTKSLAEILQPIAEHIFTLSAADYLTIPKVQEVTHEVELRPSARQAYDDLQSFLQFEIGGETMTLDEEQKFCKLQQVCNGFVYVKQEDDSVETQRDFESDKLEAVADFCERCKGENEPVLLFYAYKAEAQWLLEKLHSRGLSVMSAKQDGFLDKWNVGDIDVLMAHPASAGHGLNLQYGGRIIVWSSLTYNYELFAQANARLARQGQSKQVQIHYFIANYTIEEQQRQALMKKDKDQKQFLNLTKNENTYKSTLLF